ncbi:unnamed protein product [Adineta ricciae]|uniref:Uncharacterized protein n=1 Tax=Adineta ricciae TaxID=249248 RepID=A0A814G016_ADIRI|nr:unnamed protein product [Adineta ricciae]CAF1171947.1 unnamed protein product [Adineta ricciae]
MEFKHHVLIDSDLESQAAIIQNIPVFKGWLRAYNDIKQALDFILEIEAPYSIEIYLARNDVFNDGLPSETNSRMRNLLQTLSDLQTVHHINVYSPNVDIELRAQLTSILDDKRVLRNTLAVMDLYVYMCNEGISYFKGLISYCKLKNELHLIAIFQRSVDDLHSHLDKVCTDQRRRNQSLIADYGDKLGLEAF